ncbi:N-alpha-acetyltransferase 30 [Drosophila serrata]|uniref:N-alpha-acetyltransferase 30 n=1 Tax=Drosophila serrata TaxID=7274 RepID=UPI000A1D2EA1|nr:N-alpha-acetyltransferase 30 [Drosophila serrata]
MADAQAAAPAAAPAGAGKKKCKNKKKAEKPGPGPCPGKEEKQEEQPVSNGRASDSHKSVQELQGLLEQLQLCTGRGFPQEKTAAYSSEETPGFYLEAAVHNGHAHGHSNGNNNHIRSSNNNISSGSASHKNNVDSSNNNNSSHSKRIKDDSQMKEKKKDEVEVENEKDAKEESITATIKSTANTTTQTANRASSNTLTTSGAGEGDAAKGGAATGSIIGQEELPSTSAEAVTAAAAAAAASIPAEPEELLSPLPNISADEIVYKEYEAEHQMHDIMRLIQAELSEPYSIYTYRYFIYNWPKLCFLASHDNQYVGAIVCKLDMHMNVRRGYIAMLAVRKEYRKLKIGTTLVTKAIEAMLADNADEVVLETEMRNEPALRLYENLGFVRDKRLFRYYLNGVDALRLKLWFR